VGQEYGSGHNKFDLSNPVWLEKPPTLQKGCVVKFRDDTMSVCHITPWPNFGDELGPPVIKRILELYFGCSAEGVKVFDLATIYQGGGDSGFLNRTGSQLDTCLMSIGSLLRMVKSGDHIWGTGVAFDKTVQNRCGRKEVDNVTVYSSRGPLSAGEIQRHCDVTNLPGNNVKNNEATNTIEGAGDAGFLVPFLFPELLHKKGDLNSETKTPCYVPHKFDVGNKQWGTALPNAQPLMVGIGWVNMTLRMQSCSFVISSSLHGIIFAEALGIPSKWFQRSKNVGTFKFQDFYASLREGQPEAATPEREVESAKGKITQPLSRMEREAYARRVLKTFPIHLFHAVVNVDSE